MAGIGYIRKAQMRSHMAALGSKYTTLAARTLKIHIGPLFSEGNVFTGFSIGRQFSGLGYQGTSNGELTILAGGRFWVLAE